MKAYIISAHGEGKYDKLNKYENTIIPANMNVYFYEPLGECIDNGIAFQIQYALTHNTQPPVGPKLTYHSIPEVREVGAGFSLTGDWKTFKCGIVRVEDNVPIVNLGRNQLLTLTGALHVIRNDANSRHLGEVDAHCLFCTAA